MEIISAIQRHIRYKSRHKQADEENSEQGLIRAINDLISDGLDIHLVLPPNNDSAGTNALWWAVYADCPTLAMHLIRLGVNINAQHHISNRSTLSLAIRKNMVPVSTLLIAMGSKVQCSWVYLTTYKWGNTAITFPTDEFIKSAFITSVVRDYFLDTAVEAIQLSAESQSELAINISTQQDKIRDLKHLRIVNLKILPYEICLKISTYLVPRHMEDIFKRSSSPFDKIATEVFSYVQSHFGSACLMPYISAAQQSIIFLDTELQKLEQSKISKVVFTNIIRSLNISNRNMPGLFKHRFLPAFTKAIEKEGLESFNLIRRKEITQLAMTIYTKERIKHKALTQEFFTKSLDKTRIMHKL